MDIKNEKPFTLTLIKTISSHMKAKEPPDAPKRINFTNADPSHLPTSFPTFDPIKSPPQTTTSFSDIRFQDETTTSPQNDVNLPKGDIPTGSYVALCSKYGQRLPSIVANNIPETINGGLWYTLQGKLGQDNGVSSYLIIIPAQDKEQSFVNHLWHLNLPTKQPFHPCTPATKPSFGLPNQQF